MIMIERLCPAHLDALARLEQICFSVPWTRAQLAEELENSHAAVFVAVSNGAVCGYGGLHHVLDEAEVTNIAVDPAFRRQGIARALLAAMDDFCRANGMAFLTLEVRASNAGAIALSRGCGLGEVGRRRNFYARPTEDALLMTKFYRAQE